MKSENDILAEYVRQNHPKIACSLDFAAYRFGVKLSEAVSTLVDGIRGICEAQPTEEEIEILQKGAEEHE